MDSLKEMDRYLSQDQPPKTEPGGNRNYEQPNYKHWNRNSDQKSQKPRARGLHRGILSNI